MSAQSRAPAQDAPAHRFVISRSRPSSNGNPESHERGLPPSRGKLQQKQGQPCHVEGLRIPRLESTVHQPQGIPISCTRIRVGQCATQQTLFGERLKPYLHEIVICIPFSCLSCRNPDLAGSTTFCRGGSPAAKTSSTPSRELGWFAPCRWTCETSATPDPGLCQRDNPGSRLRRNLRRAARSRHVCHQRAEAPQRSTRLLPRLRAIIVAPEASSMGVTRCTGRLMTSINVQPRRGSTAPKRHADLPEFSRPKEADILWFM